MRLLKEEQREGEIERGGGETVERDGTSVKKEEWDREVEESEEGRDEESK